MKIDILTIFPEMFESPFDQSIVKRAKDAGKAEIHIYDLRKWTTDKHKTVDDKPFGGGAGMIMMIEPIYKALEELDPNHKAHRILFTAKGARIMQEKVRELYKKEHLVLICGHYEGVDHRVHEYLVDECISIGDFVLTGGEIPAMALTDAVVRLLPGVLGNVESLSEESFSAGSKAESQQLTADSYLEYPQYTRPAVFKTKDEKELKVPEVLLSGDHEKIAEWHEANKQPVGD
ncbi:tRNA (guanosine(37)-N1)-methyltransferase TrmD [Candidatus Dojkabacteria bacterium]|nr:tRNA (guanosine(37)-N1)-methyltransferase TrmD [Candidatus Dojkabacteria bacterium]